MVYPKLARNVRFKRISPYEYVVLANGLEESIYLNYDMVCFSRKLDGSTNPFEISTNLTGAMVMDLLGILQENQLVWDGDLYLDKWYICYGISVPLPSVMVKKIAKIWNSCLAILFLPIFLLGCYLFLQDPFDFEEQYFWIFVILSEIITIAFHESSHACACLAYDGNVKGVGFMIQKFMPAAFIAVEEENITSDMKKIQMYASGIESELFLMAVFFILSRFFESLRSFSLIFAMVGCIGVVANLTFSDSLDGSRILTVILGENIVEKVNLNHKHNIYLMKKHGALGVGIVLASYIIRISNLFVPTLIALSIWEAFI